MIPSKEDMTLCVIRRNILLVHVQESCNIYLVVKISSLNFVMCKVYTGESGIK